MRKGIKILFDNGIKPNHLFFYVLAYPNEIQDAVNRVEILHSLGVRPFIMKINQISTPELNKLAHWVNHIPYYQYVPFDKFNQKLIGKVKIPGVIEC
ncbi:hypothetical protein LCGC14_2435390 [marine sediment metagenome]|uniref:Uncharacterized protein n=1 Tax=marine sediment metagenome TaxID=412755 RepID=A0A0F9BKL6_9ZZZZ